MANRFLHINVLATLTGPDGRECVPVITGGNRDGVDFAIVEQTTQVLLEARPFPCHALKFATFFLQPRFIRVAECCHFDSGVLCEQSHMLAPPTAHADNRHSDSIARRHLGRWRYKPCPDGERCTGYEVSSLH